MNRETKARSICLGQKFVSCLANFTTYIIYLLRASFLQLITVTDGQEGFRLGFFVLLRVWELIFFLVAMGHYRVKHRSAFSQEKQHYTHHTLRTASTVTLLRHFIHYLLEKMVYPRDIYTSLRSCRYLSICRDSWRNGYSSCRTWIMKLCIAQGKDQCHANITNLISSHKENEGGRHNCSDTLS